MGPNYIQNVVAGSQWQYPQASHRALHRVILCYADSPIRGECWQKGCSWQQLQWVWHQQFWRSLRWGSPLSATRGSDQICDPGMPWACNSHVGLRLMQTTCWQLILYHRSLLSPSGPFLHLPINVVLSPLRLQTQGVPGHVDDWLRHIHTCRGQKWDEAHGNLQSPFL